MENLFVYGTLMPGESNHYQVSDIVGHWRRGSLCGHLYPEGIGLASGYPVLVPDAVAPRVQGWILSSGDLFRHWPRLDQFEGSAYRRTLLDVVADGGEALKAFVYVLAEDAGDHKVQS